MDENTVELLNEIYSKLKIINKDTEILNKYLELIKIQINIVEEEHKNLLNFILNNINNNKEISK